MKTTWERDWKAKKPKTLVGETLTPALGTLDEKLLLFKANSSKGSVSDVTEACTSAIKAAAATKAKCNKLIHKECIAYIGELEGDLAKLKATFAETERDIQDFYTSIKKIIVPLRLKLVEFTKERRPSKIPETLAEVHKLSKQFDSLKRPVGLTDEEATIAVSAFFGAVTTALDGVQKTANKYKVAAPGTPEADQLKQEWQEGMKEIEAQTKKGVNTLKATTAAKRYDLSPG